MSGKFNENAYPNDEKLALKVGAQVMFIKNDPDGRWVNGTIGSVIDCSDKNKKIINNKLFEK